MIVIMRKKIRDVAVNIDRVCRVQLCGSSCAHSGLKAVPYNCYKKLYKLIQTNVFVENFS